jgi:hypothetical protein
MCQINLVEFPLVNVFPQEVYHYIFSPFFLTSGTYTDIDPQLLIHPDTHNR